MSHLQRSVAIRARIVTQLLIVVALLALAACNNTPASNEPQVEIVTPASTGQGDPVTASTQGNAEPAANQVLPTATPAPEPPTGRIVLWHSWAERDGDALAQILTAFHQAYPTITVDTLFVAYPDLAQAYADAIQSGSGPDLVLAPNWWLGDLVRAGAVEPLDELLEPAELDAYWPATLDNLRVDGRLYGIPTNFELVTLFVNGNLVDAAATPATTDALLAAAQQNPLHGIGLYNNFYHLYWGIPAYGGQLFDGAGLATLDQDGDVASYLAWLRVFSETPGSYVDTDYGMLLDRFKKGEFAYFVDGPWAIDDLRDALGDALAVAALPAGPAGDAQPWLSADGVLLNPALSPEQEELAMIFTRYLASTASGTTLAQVARRLPANRNVRLGDDPLLEGFARQAGMAQAMPNIPEMEAVWGYGGDMLLKVVDGNADPAQTVRETAALINDANGN